MKLFSRAAWFAVLVFGFFMFGYSWRDLQNLQTPSPRAIKALFGVKSTPKASPEQVFQSNYSRILADYYKPVKANELKYAAMEGLMASLGDPHTVFLPPQAAQAFQDETKANFYGVGARLSPDTAGARVATVFEDGPAYAAGLRAGDIVTGVNGKSVAGETIDKIVDVVKGKEGTTVNLTVLRKDAPKPLKITITRRRVTIPTVEGKFFADSGVGYMSVLGFSEPTALQFDRELKKLEQNKLKGLVIDLRGNPGGLLETAVDMLSRFVDQKLVVRMKFRGGQEEVAYTERGQLHNFNYPVTVLMNEDSASASEIFAGCLKDYGKATLVGTHSYGKASVQNVFPLVDQSSAKITIARYFLPITPFFGRKVDEDNVFVSGGLEPHVKVELDLDKDPELGDPKTDSQLQKAIEVIQQKSR
ncbi:MAG: S41 family peptidase [Fimbriimonas sp.]